MQWLSFCLQELSRQREVVLASICHSPPPLKLPLGPVWACATHEEAGYLLPGRPEIQLRSAAKTLLNSRDTRATLAIALNPWVGDEDPKHHLRLHLRRLVPKDLKHLMLLDGKLRIGQSCRLCLDSLTLSDLDKNSHTLSPQAHRVSQSECTFAPASAHIAVWGAGALAHQIVKLLADTPVTVHWEAIASERQLERHPANTLLREPSTQYAWLPDNCHCLVMTHDHELDFELASQLAQQLQVRSVGVVGSWRKCERLMNYLSQAALDASSRDKIRCPIGADNASDLNAAALSIAHELTQLTADNFYPQ